MTSPGLRGAAKIRYAIGRWVRARGELSADPHGGGGLHVARTLQGAKSLKQYLKKKYGVEARVFACKIGEIIDITPGKIKTTKVKIVREVI
jgi:hypothetical protein